MGKIDYARVVLGGLLAGLVLNIGEYVLNEIVLRQQWIAAMAALGLGEPGPGQITWFIVLTFLLGIVLIWLYAAIRPRFGAGVKTAIIAGLAVWAIVWLLANVFSAASGYYPAQLAVIAMIWGIVEVSVASVAGAWLYREG
jgi:hypothetical protein